VKTLEGEVFLRSLKGKALLIVNVAWRADPAVPRCRNSGIREARLPSSGFATNSRPRSPAKEEIRAFAAEVPRDVPAFEKIAVNGRRRHPIYRELTKIADSDGEAGDVQWNFEKFVVSADGNTITRFRPTTKPNARAVIKAIEAGLPKRKGERA
jgi:glutathione peroxidase